MKKMLWLGVVIVVVGLCSSGALAASMGPPVAGLDAGQFSVGIDYSNSEIGIEGSEKISGTINIDGPEIEDLDIPISGKDKFKEDVESDMILANLGYGISDNLEVALLLGVADFGIADLDGSDEFAYGFNVKATFYEEANLKLGALLQMTFSSNEASFIEDEDIPGTEDEIDVDATFDIDYYQLKIAVGPSYDVTEGVSIYGGPFYHLFSGDYDIKKTVDMTIEDHDVTGSVKTSGDMDEQSSFGGYIGAQIDITENLPLAVEYQFTGDADILGLSLVYRF